MPRRSTLVAGSVLAMGFVLAAAGLWREAGAAPQAGPTPSGDGPPPPEALERARAIADELTRTLSARLLAELQAGGPAQAIKVCAEVSPAIAAAHANATTRVRRVSLRYRNPADAPDDFEARALEGLEASHREGTLPAEQVAIVREAGQRTLRYLRPIRVGDTCLKCHGPAESIDPAVRATLADRYPGDRAVGYRTGDLRGAISVTILLD